MSIASCATAEIEECYTADELSDLDSTKTAVEFWDARKLKFYVKTDEDGVVVPSVTGQFCWTFPLNHGKIIIEHNPEESYVLMYGESNNTSMEWKLVAQVLLAAKSGSWDRWTVFDADNFEFGTSSKPINIRIKTNDVRCIIFDMRYIRENFRENSDQKELDDILAVEPSLTSKELLDKFRWSQQHELPNTRRANLLRVETSCNHLVHEMTELPDYLKLGEELRNRIAERFYGGWTLNKANLAFWEPTKNCKRKLDVGITGGPITLDEASLATTFGYDSLEILGSVKSLEILGSVV